jgi:hypothetical protein
MGLVGSWFGVFIVGWVVSITVGMVKWVVVVLCISRNCLRTQKCSPLCFMFSKTSLQLRH